MGLWLVLAQTHHLEDTLPVVSVMGDEQCCKIELHCRKLAILGIYQVLHVIWFSECFN